MNMHVEAPDVNAIKTPFISTANDKVVDLTTLHGIQDQMECGCYSDQLLSATSGRLGAYNRPE